MESKSTKEQESFKLKTVTRFGEILISSPTLFLGIEKSLTYLASSFKTNYITLNKCRVENNQLYAKAYFAKSNNMVLLPTRPKFNEYLYDSIPKEFTDKTFSGESTIVKVDESFKSINSKYTKNIERLGITSFVVIPILIGNTYWGDLTLTYKENVKTVWKESDHFYFKLISQQLSNFIKLFEGEENLKTFITSNHSQKMASLGEMAAGIAHEINNPLFIINAFATKIDNLIERDSLSIEELKKVSSMIQKNCKRISGIVSGLSMFSRESSKDNLEVACLRDIVSSSLEFSKERMRISEINLQVNIGTQDLPVECKASQLSQVIVNLLNNSYDSISTKEEAKWIKIDVKDDTDRVFLYITDSGEKLPIKEQQRIMEPFYTTKSVGKGTGLGLSISREIINRHNGDFYIDPFCDNVRFVIELPKLEFE